ncbi:DUF6949 family protein [Methylobacterium sp. NFXW15]|uniref:DUF6949 family protein n=1 Tax=Methylobacterium sp. NFXW15 TaxID=2819512 RepID=UPI003CF1D06F
MTISAAAFDALRTLCIGFALSGLLASAFELFAARRASFNLLERGGVLTVVALPLLAFSAPFIILRNTVRGRRIEGRPVPFVMLATMIACGWSLLSGRLALNLAAMIAGV